MWKSSHVIPCTGQRSHPWDSLWFVPFTRCGPCGTNNSVQVLIKHRATDDSLRLVEQILKSFHSRYVYLSYEDHDIVTANTQAVTHAAFLRYALPPLFLRHYG